MPALRRQIRWQRSVVAPISGLWKSNGPSTVATGRISRDGCRSARCWSRQGDGDSDGGFTLRPAGVAARQSERPDCDLALSVSGDAVVTAFPLQVVEKWMAAWSGGWLRRSPPKTRYRQHVVSTSQLCEMTKMVGTELRRPSLVTCFGVHITPAALLISVDARIGPCVTRRRLRTEVQRAQIGCCSVTLNLGGRAQSGPGGVALLEIADGQHCAPAVSGLQRWWRCRCWPVISATRPL